MTTPVSAIPEGMYPSLLRKFAWDLLPCQLAQSFMPVIGLVPSSAEGAEIEHRESHKRLTGTDPLDELLPEYSGMAARVLASLALRLHAGTELEPGILDTVVTQFAQTIHCGATVAIANLIEQGYLQLGPKITGQPGE